MFPDEDMSEDDAEWDDFGCPLKPSDFALAGRLSLAGTESPPCFCACTCACCQPRQIAYLHAICAGMRTIACRPALSVT